VETYKFNIDNYWFDRAAPGLEDLTDIEADEALFEIQRKFGEGGGAVSHSFSGTYLRLRKEGRTHDEALMETLMQCLHKWNEVLTVNESNPILGTYHRAGYRECEYCDARIEMTPQINRWSGD
jgi:hypothetical protein